jgi:flavin reductase ActVB
MSCSTAGADPTTFRAALARFPSGVTIVTTRDASGEPWGFTANAFSSLSLSPPLVLACLDKTANCHPVFAEAPRFAINILTPAHAELARRFATKAADKYAAAGFVGERQEPPVLHDASAVLWCDAEQLVPAGDHTILIGHVTDVRIGDEDSLVYYRGAFLTPGPELGLPHGSSAA